jgi:hypothetical protein
LPTAAVFAVKLVHFGGQVEGAPHEGSAAGPDGPDDDGRGNVRFADARLADQVCKSSTVKPGNDRAGLQSFLRCRR